MDTLLVVQMSTPAPPDGRNDGENVLQKSLLFSIPWSRNRAATKTFHGEGRLVCIVRVIMSVSSA